MPAWTIINEVWRNTSNGNRINGVIRINQISTRINGVIRNISENSMPKYERKPLSELIRSGER